MEIGVHGYTDSKQTQMLLGMLWVPFAKVLPDQKVVNGKLINQTEDKG